MSSPVDLFCLKTEQLLQLEKEAELQESRFFQRNVSPKLLEKRGICLYKLVIDSRKTSLYGRQVVTFKSSNVNRPELPATNISSGDIVGLHEVSSPTSIGSGIVLKVTLATIAVAFDQGEELSTLGDDNRYYLVRLANDVTYKVLRRAVSKLGSDRNTRSGRLIELTFQAHSDEVALANSTLDRLTYFNSQLDESQQAAVKLALSQPRLSIIHGPPGTGKSTTLVETIRQFVAQGSKVLACAPSNVAVDNLVLRLAKAKVLVTRLGHPARATNEIHCYCLDAKLATCEDSSIVEDIRSDIDSTLKKMRQSRGTPVSQSVRQELKSLRKELKTRSEEAMKQVLKGSEVILSTLTSASDDGPLRLLGEGHFDVVVIDECSQALEISCWIALPQAPKCVLAGDHLQLPPTILSHKAAAEGLSVTLMERLIDSHSSHVHMLTVQYRMNSQIMQWASDELYNRKLTASSTVSTHLLRDITGVEDNEVTCEPLILIDTAGCDLPELELPDEQSKGNEGEADLVAIHVESLIQSGVNAADIAVISPYNFQVELIRNRLSDKYKNLEIKSVDGYQGREKEAVVISLVRSNNKGVVGFLAEDRRLNVAVTRARRQVAVVCDSDTVSRHPFLSRLISYMSAHGVVKTAAEYQQDYHVGALSEKVARLMKESDSTRQTKTSDKKSYSSKGKPKSAQKQSQPSPVDSSIISSTTEKSETQEERTRRIRDEFSSVIVDFVRSSATSHSFPPTLNSFQRLVVHQLAEDHNLKHTSVGEGAQRHIIIEKPHKTEATKKHQLEYIAEKANTEAQSVSTKTESPALKEFTCDMCGKLVPKTNLYLHKLRCAPVLSSLEVTHTEPVSHDKGSPAHGKPPDVMESCKPKTQSANKPKKKKKEKKKVDSGEAIKDADGDDFDALLAAADQLNSVCNFKKCKTLVRTLGVNCQFCKLRFCLSHGMPEVHGCGAEAKTQARSTFIKEGRLFNGGVASNKKPNAAARAGLERRLNKKLSELTDKRKPKEKDK